ncbi:putative ras-GEF domain-containing family member 1B isoform X2, partial [Apostichopus japonicus]
VTSHLLDGEQRKLVILQKQLEVKRKNGKPSSSSKAKRDYERQKASLERLQFQHCILEQEYREAATGMFTKHYWSPNSQRSLPHLGIRQLSKNRPSIFGTIAHDSPAGSGVPPTQ